ncbi:MAG: SBBP repeat-containing protein [Acidiferrobacterales bacterium]
MNTLIPRRRFLMIMPVVLAVFLAACGSSGGGGGIGGSGNLRAIIPFGTKQMGVTGQSTYGQSVAIDSIGNVYVAGSTDGSLDGNTLTGMNDFFLTQYNAAGTKVYTKQMGVTGVVTEGESVATDSSGNVYVAGSTDGGLDGNTLMGTEDFFVTRYSTAGVHN